ncbi:hypothetical protein [Sporomusa paucivorans]
MAKKVKYATDCGLPFSEKQCYASCVKYEVCREKARKQLPPA